MVSLSNKKINLHQLSKEEALGEREDGSMVFDGKHQGLSYSGRMFEFDLNSLENVLYFPKGMPQF